MFKVSSTSDKNLADAIKALLVTPHGWGKTTQFQYMQERYGKGLIISGESGLISLMGTNIDYVNFNSWDGDHDPENGIYSFKGILKMLKTPDFKKVGYTWIGVDSITEVSERLMEFLEDKHANNKNTFDKWSDNARYFIGAMKEIRDLPIHVLMTCLAGEEKDPNDNTVYTPLIKGQKVAKQLQGLFDYVFCGERQVKKDANGAIEKVNRFIVTDEVKGWQGKARDPFRRLKPVERCDNVVTLLDKVHMSEEDLAHLISANKEQKS